MVKTLRDAYAEEGEVSSDRRDHHRPDPDGRDNDPRVLRSRTRLLAAATELLIEAGPRGVTVDAVAERSGVAKSTLYRHWSSVTEMLVDVMRANVPTMSPPDLTEGFEAALRTVMREIASSLSSPEWVRIMPSLVLLQHQRPEIADILTADREATEALIGSILDLGVEEGLLPVGIDRHRASQLLVGPLFLAMMMADFSDVDDLTNDSIDHFIAAHRVKLAPPESPSPKRSTQRT